MTNVHLSRRAMLVGAAGLLLAQRSPSPADDAVPQVDRLSVRFLVDGAVSSFAEPLRRPDLLVERGARGQPDVTRRLLAEFGLSLLIESRMGDVERTALLDFGYSADALLNNASLIGADLSRVDAMLLSHGHYDHFGGLNGLLSTGRVRRGVPLLVGGEEAMCHRLRGTGDSPLDFGALDRQALLRAGVDLRIASRPQLLAGHGQTTGRISLDIERPRTPTTMEPGRNCDRALLDPDKRDFDRVEDDSRHELGLAYHVRGRGLVVFGSCSHRGILNTIAAARRATGVQRLHAVVGGFHLVRPQTEDDARRTARAMAELAPDYVVPGHCSGEWFIAAAEAAMPGKIIRPYVGTRLLFGAQG